MLEELLNEATSAAHAGDWQKAERLVHQLAGSPDEGIQVAVKALGRFGKLRTELAIKVIHLIGFVTVAKLMYLCYVSYRYL